MSYLAIYLIFSTIVFIAIIIADWYGNCDFSIRELLICVFCAYVPLGNFLMVVFLIRYCYIVSNEKNL